MLDQLLYYVSLLAWVWFALVVALIARRAFSAGGVNEAMRALFSYRTMVALFVAIFLTLLSASLVFIEPQESAVVVSVLSPNGYREQPLRSGLHFIVPLAERVVQYPIYWQTYTMSKEVDEGVKTGDDSISARTSDGQLVYLDSSVIYRIDGNEVVRLHIELQNRYVADFIRPIMRGVIRTEVSQFTADEINSSKRKNLEANLEELLRAAFNGKGFVLDRFLLRNVSFSGAYSAALEAKQVAEQGRIQTDYQAEQMRRLAQGESDRSRILAEGRAAAIKIEADAQAAAVTLIRDALQNDPLTAQFWAIQKLNPNVQLMVLPANSPFLFPLPNMGQPLAGASSIYSSTLPLTTTFTLPPALLPTPGPSSPGMPLSATPTPTPAAP